MEAVAGVFALPEKAMDAVNRLRRRISTDRISLLSPGTTERELHGVPTTKDMPPVGKYIGGALGGALGLGLGASVLLPGIGAVAVFGLAAAALLGVGGAVAGGLAGHAADESGSEGLPVDEMFVYEDALRTGRSVLIVQVENNEQDAFARKAMSEAGAESIDAAKENWWLGLRSAEKLRYESSQPVPAGH